MMRKINVCLGVLFVGVLGGLVYQQIPYQLCQLEHTNLFVGDWDWFLPFLSRMGGMAQWLGTWGIQFFDDSIIGALAFILPLIGLFASIGSLLCQLGKNMQVWVPLATIVPVCQLLSLYDYNFYWSGAVALALATILLWLVSLFKPFVRNVFFLICIPWVVWLLGAISWVYVLGGIVLFGNRKKWLTTVFAPLVIFGSIMSLLYFTGVVSALSMALSPMAYHESLLEMPWYHWTTWIAVILVLGLGRFIANWECKKAAMAWTFNLLGWLLPSALLVQFGGNFYKSSNLDVWRLNHYAYLEDWDAILDFMAGKPMNNYLFMNYTNMALAHKGELANRAFHYYPRGMNSLLATANATGAVRLLASDVHYTVGCVAEAQQHAFEAQVTFPNSLGIQTLKRLVKTNLIFGHYEVAEKYLSLIAKTTLHKEWAKKYSLFLYNDEAIEADAELGEKRRSLSKRNRFAMFYGWQPELKDILDVNPDNTKALEYLGVSFLMNKDLDGFRNFLDSYYEAKAGKQLPLSFQQAVMALDSQEKIDEYGISAQVKGEYNQFMRLYAQNRQNPNLKNLMHRSFGHTVWYYLIFV